MTSYQALPESPPPLEFALRPVQGFEHGLLGSVVPAYREMKGRCYGSLKLEGMSTEMLSECFYILS